GVGVLPRSNAQNGFEFALEMEWALVKFPAEAVKGQEFVEMLLDVAANTADEFEFRVAAQGAWMAPQAGALSGAVRSAGRRNELDVLAPGPAGSEALPFRERFHSPQFGGNNDESVSTDDAGIVGFRSGRSGGLPARHQACTQQ